MNVREQLTLRRKFIAYIIIVHLLFAGIATFLLWKTAWILAIELVTVCSLVLGIRYIRALFVPIQLMKTGTDLIDDQEFTTRFVEIGQIEMDQLIRVYNRMVDHLRAERTRLREQHYFLEKILNISPAGVIIFDFDDRIAIVNPSAEKILQFSSEQLIGQTLSLLGGGFVEALYGLQNGESQVLPLQGQRRIKCFKSQFIDQGFSRTFIMLEELTEELRQSEKVAYEKLIRTTSHEINNTVGAVNSLLKSCLNYQEQIAKKDREDYITALQVATTRNDHLNDFIRAYADVVKLPPPTRGDCDIQTLLENIVFLMDPAAKKHHIKWQWELDEILPPISLDKNQMEQVFVNILKNAMEAIGDNGTVTIRIGRANHRFYVVIEDSGKGIPPEVHANLFTPFFSTKPNGQGVGLTLVQEILTQHQFEFTLESLPPTQFTIYFS